MSQNWDRNILGGIPFSYSQMVQVVHRLRLCHLVQEYPRLLLHQVHQEGQGGQEDPECGRCGDVGGCGWDGGFKVCRNYV